ncbi:MAG: hypothetical protein JWM46_452, partial [Candidatus Kaiserbacteria bacterium]|nr:hypothetical protein [Candidatus Kaiserbacteria bacterium]
MDTRSEAGTAHQVLLFYRYITIDSPQELAAHIESLARENALTGRVIIAQEGVNATLEGLRADTEAFLSEFKIDERFRDIEVKR